MSSTPGQASLDQTLASNLTSARVGTRTTQQDLAEFSRISRATIAQIESGASDPRISTLERLANALNLPVFILLATPHELTALTRLHGHQLTQPTPSLPPEVIRKIRRLASTGSRKDLLRAARLAGELAAPAGDASARAAAISAVLIRSASYTFDLQPGSQPTPSTEQDVQQSVQTALLLADLLRDKRSQ